jgi:hypothetical protein
MTPKPTDKQAASRRRKHPKPTLWAEGITRRDRLFLWWLAYRLTPKNLPFKNDLTPEVLKKACEKCRYPYDRLLELQRDYPEAWERMLVKRAHHICGTKDPQRTNDRWSAALMTNTKCRHPRIAHIMGLPCYGSFLRPLRARTADTRAHAREETQEASRPPASVDTVTEVHENLGISADVATDEREHSEIAQPEWFREFIDRPGCVPRDDREPSVLDSWGIGSW